jgi:hypothetical protein
MSETFAKYTLTYLKFFKSSFEPELCHINHELNDSFPFPASTVSQIQPQAITFRFSYGDEELKNRSRGDLFNSGLRSKSICKDGKTLPLSKIQSQTTI